MARGAELDEVFDSGRELEIEVGTPVALQIEGVAERLASTLVGIKKGEYGIVTMPASRIGLESKLHRGNSIVVRYIHDGRAFAFQSVLLGSIKDPVPLLILNCPRVLEIHSLRGEDRINCRLPSEVVAGEENLPGVVVDLSASGCQFWTGAEEVQALAEGAVIELALSLPGRSEAVHVPAGIRHVE